jgi:hypothetical protein
LLRYIEILLISPWKVELSEGNGYAISPARTVQVANPAGFLAQKILIHEQRDYKDRAKDLLYMNDTIEVFSETLEELQNLFRATVAPKLHPRPVAELEEAADRLFGRVDDTSREAVRMAAGRTSPVRSGFVIEVTHPRAKNFLRQNGRRVGHSNLS